MSQAFIQLFNQQSRRDQVALSICTMSVLVAILWAGIIQPLGEAASNSERRLQNDVATLARVKSLAANLQYYENNQRRPRGQQISIVGVIDRSSRAAGLTYSSANPSGNGQEATVRFDRAPLAAMLQWLYDLENAYQVQIEDLRLSSSAEAGFVSGSVRIKK